MIKILNDFSQIQQRLLWAGLVLMLICSFFSVGYYHGDEHWQLLEFANYKLGFSGAKDLPWEYPSKIRPGFQPMIVFSIAKILIGFNLYDPFALALILRILTVLMSWFAIILVHKMLKIYTNDERLISISVMCSFFIWFMPYQHVRFSSENWAAILFIYGLFFFVAQSKTLKNVNFIMAGLFFGLAFNCRYQIAIAVIGLIAWSILYKKINISNFLMLCVAGLIAIGFGTIIDKWLYGEWVFAPYNYFEFNILQHGANQFGTEPWYWYFNAFIEVGGVPVSLIILFALFTGLRNGYKSHFAWIFIFFLLAHSAIAHKELRFLSPMLYFMPILIAFGLSGLDLNYWYGKKYIRVVLIIVVGINFLLLAVATLKPGDDSLKFYSFIFDQANDKKVTVLYLDNNPYYYGLKQNFYKSSNIDTMKLENAVPFFLANKKGDKILLFHDGKNPEKDKRLVNMPLRKVFGTIPEWLYFFNFNNWISRANTWNVYEIEVINPNK